MNISRLRLGPMQVFLVMETIISQGPLNPTESQNDLNLDHSFIQNLKCDFLCVCVVRSWGGQQTAVIKLRKAALLFK